MPNLIYLGNYASVDTTEYNWTAESEGSLVGINKDYSQLSIVSANVSDGGDGAVTLDMSKTWDEDGLTKQLNLLADAEEGRLIGWSFITSRV